MVTMKMSIKAKARKNIRAFGSIERGDAPGCR
jgi:hypothetical protein